MRIVGDGPAAMATAIALCAAGVAVRCRRPPRRRGPAAVRTDSLSPAGHALLSRLGVAEAFAADGHLRCPTHVAAWGPGGLRHVDFITHPQGCAWLVDRSRFDARLQQRALALGLQWESADSAHDGVQATVDASGRGSHFARRQGAVRRREDRQLAWLTHLPAGEAAAQAPAAAPQVLVEATADGWWYSAPAPGGGWSLACFTDADLRPPVAAGSAGWLHRLADAPHTLDRLIDHGVPPQALLARPGRLLPADSSRLDRFCGPGWLAVGDAAMGYDPLSSHGLTVALQSGLDAAQALLAWRDGDARALQAYADRLERAHAAYRQARAAHYRDETRHAAHRYWQRRWQPAYSDATSSPV